MCAEHPEGERELYELRRGDSFGFPADPFQETSRHVGGPHERPESAALQARLGERLAELKDRSADGCRR